MADNYTKDFIDEVKGAIGSSTSNRGTVDQAARDSIDAHANNTEIHVTSADKSEWDDKISCTAIGEILVFN